MQRIEWRRRVVDRVPVPCLTHAHEVFLAGAMFLIGLGLVLQEVRPESVHSQVSTWMAQGWAWSLFAGSGLILWGVFSYRPRMEWAGLMLTGWATFFYSVALFTGTEFQRSGVAATIFLGVASVSWWRAFQVTSASDVQHRLTRAARDAHVRATAEREEKDRHE